MYDYQKLKLLFLPDYGSSIIGSFSRFLPDLLYICLSDQKPIRYRNPKWCSSRAVQQHLTSAWKLNSTFLLWSDVLYAVCRVDKQGLSGYVRLSCANTDTQYFLSIQCQCLWCNDHHPVKNYLIKLKLAIIWFTAGHLIMILCNNAENIQA